MLNCTRQMCAVGVVMIMVTLTHGMETSTTRTTDAVTETGLGKLRAQTVPPPQGTGHSVREGADGHAENGKLRTKADERGEDSPAVSTPADTRTTQSMLNIVNEAIEPSRSHVVVRDLVVIFFYSLVMLVSLFGNLVVIKVILFRQAMRKRITNVFIANLTISDLIVTVFTIPMNIARTILDNWPFGETMCKLFPFVQALSVYVSALSMTMIAIDRYQALVRPLQNRVSHRVPRSALIGGIWIVSAVLSLPYGVFNRLTTYDVYQLFANLDNIDGEPIYRCFSPFRPPYNRVLTMFQFVTQYLVPLSVVALSYTAIGLKISKRVCIGETTLEQAQTHLNAKRKTIKMLMFVVAVFAICWLPYHVMFMLEDFLDINFTLSFQYAIKWLAMSSICYNPFIYFWLNNGYRQGILKALTCCGCTGAAGTAMTLNSSLGNAANGGQLNAGGGGGRGGGGGGGATMARSSSARSTLSNLANGAATLCQPRQQTSGRKALFRDANNNNKETEDARTLPTSNGSSQHLQIIYIGLQDNCAGGGSGDHRQGDEDDDAVDSDIEERPARAAGEGGQHLEELIELVKHKCDIWMDDADID